MLFYSLTTVLEDEYGIPPFLVTNRELVNKDCYQDKILLKKFYDQPEVLELLLTDMEDDRQMVLRDFHRWGIGRPNAIVLPVSARFKALLEKLVLPPHRFYKVNLHIAQQQQAHEYCVGHVIFDYLEHVDFARSTFHVTTRTQDLLVEAFEEGAVGSLEEYRRLSKEAVNIKKAVQVDGAELQSRCELRPVKIQFKQASYFDLWELRGQLVLSEKAKHAIEETEITGVAMPSIQESRILQNIEILIDQK